MNKKELREIRRRLTRECCNLATSIAATQDTLREKQNYLYAANELLKLRASASPRDSSPNFKSAI